MRFAALITVTMIAFAANSILNRLAVDAAHATPGSFAVIRVLAGAITLVVLARFQGRGLTFWSRQRAIGASALTLYMVGFSLAYVSLDAGLGALLLFGVVQITMFVLSALRGAPATGRQIIGAGVAFCGLAWVLWPGPNATTSLTGAGFMVLAGIGWAYYTLAGRSEPDALAATAANFCLALPLTAVATWAAGGGMQADTTGIGLAILSGAVTSGLGYAMWYAIVPRLDPAVAAILQLSVPVIALAAGVMLLGEGASPRLIAGTIVVLGGIAFALGRPKRT